MSLNTPLNLSQVDDLYPLSLEELAGFIRKPTRTIINERHKIKIGKLNANHLPQATRIGGTPHYLAGHLKQWLLNGGSEVVARTPIKRGRGRPRKDTSMLAISV